MKPSAPSPGSTPLSYEQAGVNYDLIDPLKVSAQRAAAATAVNLAGHGFTEVQASRGESAYVVDVGPFYIASIVECLGSKALVAGWQRACHVCKVAWGGGETPALAGIVEAGRIDLAASCTGLINPKARLSVGDKLATGDAIVLLASSGIHANGLSLARKISERLPQGYLTPIDDNGTSFGDALLAPTTLYSPVTEALWQAGITPHYAANITGHGWRKLLRHPGVFTYRLHSVPAVPAVLQFMQHHAGQDDHEAYSTLNMGAGFALFVAAEHAERTVAVAREQGVEALLAGRVEAGGKQLLIEPLGLRFGDDALQLR